MMEWPLEAYWSVGWLASVRLWNDFEDSSNVAFTLTSNPGRKIASSCRSMRLIKDMKAVYVKLTVKWLDDESSGDIYQIGRQDEVLIAVLKRHHNKLWKIKDSQDSVDHKLLNYHSWKLSSSLCIIMENLDRRHTTYFHGSPPQWDKDKSMRTHRMPIIHSSW